MDLLFLIINLVATFVPEFHFLIVSDYSGIVRAALLVFHVLSS